MDRADGTPASLSAIDFAEPAVTTSTMGSFTRTETFSVAGLAASFRAADRQRCRQGLSMTDLKIRHREQVRRRAQALLDSDATQSASAADEASGAAAMARREAARKASEQEAAIRLRRLTQPPPVRFWWLLFLWLAGGIIGAHRLPLRKWRVAGIQSACVALGVALLSTTVALLHPKHVPEHTYTFREAYYVAAFGYTFLALSVVLWLRDGRLLAHGRLKLQQQQAAAAARRKCRRCGGGRRRHADADAGGARSWTPGAARRAAARRLATWRPSHRMMLVIWLVLGLPFCAHRWLRRYNGHAAFHCALNAIALALLVTSGESGSLRMAYALGILLGVSLISIALVLWTRDLAQIFRGRLGPRRAAAPEFWLLLVCTAGLGSLGIHRLLLGRHRSAPLFPLLLLIGGWFALDAASGFTWNAVVSGTDYAKRRAAILAAMVGLSGDGGDADADGEPGPGDQGEIGSGGATLTDALNGTINATLGRLLQSAMGGTTALDVPGSGESPDGDAGSGWNLVELQYEEQEMSKRELGMRLTQAVVALAALAVLAGALLRDLSRLVRGRLKPQPESQLYWRIMYAWLLVGLPFGFHRLVASKTSWRIFPILNGYGVALLCVGEIYFKNNEGDPSVSPAYFARGTAIATDVIAGLMMLSALVLWLRDLPAVLRGRLPFRGELAVFWQAFLTWLLPTGYLFGLHFAVFGRPLDWRLFTSLTIVGILTGITARQYAAHGVSDLTFSLSLVAALACFGINALFFLKDGLELRMGGLLQRQLSNAAFRRVRLLWLIAGFPLAGHHLALGRFVPTILTLALNCLGTWLLLVTQLLVSGRGDGGAREAYGHLRVVSITCLITLLLLWLKDGALLLLGKVQLRGDRLEVVEAADSALDGGAAAVGEIAEAASQGGADMERPHPAEWRCFRTHRHDDITIPRPT